MTLLSGANPNSDLLFAMDLLAAILCVVWAREAKSNAGVWMVVGVGCAFTFLSIVDFADSIDISLPYDLHKWPLRGIIWRGMVLVGLLGGVIVRHFGLWGEHPSSSS